jgi:nucleoside-diphosphate-sugar epimerase
MRVLVIGATGYIGAAVTDRLLHQGHQVVALLRSARPVPAGVSVRVADLKDPASVRPELVADVDAVVHAGAPTGDWDIDLASVRSLLRGLCGRDRTFVYVSGTWVLGRSPVVGGVRTVLDEFSPPRPISLMAGRERVEDDVVGAVGCRGVVIRPGLVHGAGGGIPSLLIGWARHERIGRFVSAGEAVMWPMVHVGDLSDLVCRVLDVGRSGQLVHAVAEPAVDVVAVAAAADLAAGGLGYVEPWPLVEASRRLGAAFAGALTTSQHVIGLEAPALGWRPTRMGVVDDLRGGSYVVDAQQSATGQ